MGFLGGLLASAYGTLQDRSDEVLKYKEEYERSLAYRSDDDIFLVLKRLPPTSSRWAAVSLILQDRGYSAHEVSERYQKMKHRR